MWYSVDILLLTCIVKPARIRKNEIIIIMQKKLASLYCEYNYADNPFIR